MEHSFFRFSLSPHKNVWEGYFENPGGDRCRLIFSATPGEIALFTDSDRPPKKTNVIHFFEDLEGQQVTSVDLASNDRFIYIHFDSRTLQFQLFGNRANLLLVEGSIVIDAFKNTEEVSGRSAPQPRAPKKVAPAPESEDAKQLLLHVDQKFPRHLISPVLKQYQLEQKHFSQIKSVTHQLTDAMKERAEFRVLTNGSLCLIPEDLLPLETLKTFENINNAIRHVYYRTSRLRRLDKRMQQLRPDIEKKLKGARKSQSQIEQPEEALEKADELEKKGHLLMANAHRNSEKGGQLEVRDFYNNNQTLQISLKPSLSIAENAEQYYDRAGKARRRVQEIKRRRKELTTRITNLEELLSSLDRLRHPQDFDGWEKEHEQRLNQLGIGSEGDKRSPLPWRRSDIGGYEVWIGKNARSNDKLTRAAHKEDIWLHARGAAGSHVVIRMDGKKTDPPAHVVERVAAWAAWHSKLRGSSLVPVIVTRRKYVTKPKGAPAGTVRIQREEVQMVPPREP